jgi:predicted ArsR family transcriptional regulator
LHRKGRQDEITPLIAAKIVETFGGKGLEVLSAAYEEAGGRENGSKIAKTLHIDNTDLPAAISIVETLCIIFGIHSISNDESRDRITLTLDACPFEDTLKLYRASLCTYYLRGLVHAINPEVRIKIPKKICEGDKNCIFQFSCESDNNPDQLR